MIIIKKKKFKKKYSPPLLSGIRLFNLAPGLQENWGGGGGGGGGGGRGGSGVWYGLVV